MVINETADGATEKSGTNEVTVAAELENQQEEEEDPEARQERKAAYAEHVFQLEKFERVWDFLDLRWTRE